MSTFEQIEAVVKELAADPFARVASIAVHPILLEGIERVTADTNASLFGVGVRTSPLLPQNIALALDRRGQLLHVWKIGDAP